MEKLKVNIVLEILGRPPENVKEALNTLIVKLGAEKGVKVIEKIYHDPVEVKDSKDLYTAFAEVSLELDSLDNYFLTIFSYMPSHIEVVSPENIELSNSYLNELANQITLRLHNYDAIAKKIIFERDILLRKLQEVAPHLFKKKEDEQKDSSKSLEESLVEKNKKEEKKDESEKKTRKEKKKTV